jgi:DNA invertase Pin-like site-specific DNA recombinase
MTETDTRSLRVIGYCRVSTKDQGENGHGLGAQRQVLERFCEQHGHELLTVTTDVVSGGAPDCMYGRQVAIAAIESGVADALLVRALDRATRDQLDHAKLFKQAERNAWRLMDCDGADSGVPHQRLTADVRNAVAAEQRRLISERTKEGLAKARKHGTKSGRPIGRPTQIDPATAKQIVRLRMQEGLSANAIADRLTKDAGNGQKWRYAGDLRLPG